jgi:hypothetical protein
MRKYRVIWLVILTKTTRLRQDNLFRDRDLQQGPIEYKTELITARLVFSVFCWQKVCEGSASQQAPLCARKIM